MTCLMIPFNSWLLLRLIKHRGITKFSRSLRSVLEEPGRLETLQEAYRLSTVNLSCSLFFVLVTPLISRLLKAWNYSTYSVDDDVQYLAVDLSITVGSEEYAELQ